MNLLRSTGLAVVVSGMVMAGVLGWAAVLRQQAAKVSHEQPESTKQVPRANLVGAEAVRRGRTLFLNSCAHCHGEDARGDEGPDLHSLEISDRRIFNVIKHGIKGEMPSFAKKHPDPEVALLLAYLRSLPKDEDGSK